MTLETHFKSWYILKVLQFYSCTYKWKIIFFLLHTFSFLKRFNLKKLVIVHEEGFFKIHLAFLPPFLKRIQVLIIFLQANTLPGSSLSLPPSHMYGNRLNPNSAMAALIAQSENSQAGKLPAAGDKCTTSQT